MHRNLKNFLKFFVEYFVKFKRMISDVQLSLKFITKFEDNSICDTIYPLILKANIGRDAPDIILSKKPSSQLRRKSKSSEYENHESKCLRKDAKKSVKIQKIDDFNLEDEDKEICSFIFRRDKTNSLRSINQTRNYEENQKYNRKGFANQSHSLSKIVFTDTNIATNCCDRDTPRFPVCMQTQKRVYLKKKIFGSLLRLKM